MKKRAAIARPLAMDPEILFFDEPSAGLDPIMAAGIDDLILNLKKAYALTMIVVTHELASAFLIADRIILIDRGHILATGLAKQIQQSTQPRGRIRYRARSNEVGAYEYHRWMERPSAMIQDLLVQALRARRSMFSGKGGE
jgi:phospholipid/cholesterol/gamma-HCH transport system ATP-binding protein